MKSESEDVLIEGDTPQKCIFQQTQRWSGTQTLPARSGKKMEYEFVHYYVSKSSGGTFIRS